MTDFDPQDQEIIQLLGKLRAADQEYPQELLAARRQRYLQRMGQISLGIGAGTAVSEAAKSASGSAASTGTAATSMTSTILETALIMAIVLEAATVAYFYREKVSDALKTFVTSAEVREVSPSSISAGTLSAAPTILVTPSPSLSSTPIDPTASPTAPSLTITPSQVPDILVVEATGGVTTPVVNVTTVVEATHVVVPTNPVSEVPATPVPRDNTDNGNHYGQTPQPERTKESGNNDTGPSDNTAPQLDNNPRPTKSK